MRTGATVTYERLSLNVEGVRLTVALASRRSGEAPPIVLLPRMFMYGEQNASLSYLPALAAGGVELADIPNSGHFPMYSNPVAMWRRIAEFQNSGSDAR